MSSSARRRLERLEQTVGVPGIDRLDIESLIDHTAREIGVTPEQIKAEMAGLRSRCEAAGIRTVDATIAFVAADLDVTPAFVRQEVESMMSAVG
jgi:hypothetical protein